MAANTNLFTDKETNNWFKASIALIVAKKGLTNFLDTALQNVHAVVGGSCGNCPIEKLIPCPTYPHCNKRKRNYCPFHKSQKPQPCPTCDNAKQNIISQHRYGGPSWKNIRAEKWALDYWEIGKCFLPPDGYISVSSVQESDFNGVISIILNCLHFQTCLSSTCLSPPPPDKHCPLEKVRQIGRDIRHTSDCKVADADLQDYFQTLSTLLADPTCLQLDPLATIARTRLSDLQNDRMPMEELGDLLKEAEHTLKHAKEAGERFSKEAENTMAKALAASILEEHRLKKTTQVGAQRLKNTIQVGEKCLKKSTQVGAQRLKNTIQVGEKCLKNTTQVGKNRLKKTPQVGVKRLKKTTQVGAQRLKNTIQVGGKCLKKTTQVGKKRLKKTTQVGGKRLKKTTQVGEQRLKKTTHDEKECLKKTTQVGEKRLKKTAQVWEQRLKKTTKVEEQSLKKMTQVGEKRLKNTTHVGEKRLKKTTKAGEKRLKSLLRTQQSENETTQVDYERGIEDFRRRLIHFYTTKMNTVSVFPLREGCDKPIWDIFVPPKLIPVNIEQDGSRTKGNNTIQQYNDIFYKDQKLNRVFIQGDPGMGKSTFLIKLAIDWCDAVSLQTSNFVPTFSDIDSLIDFKFLFHISLRDAIGQREVIEMIKTQIIDIIYTGDERKKAFKLLQQILKQETCIVTMDGLNEWADHLNKYNVPLIANNHTQCVSLITTRPWKMTDERFKDSEIDRLIEIEGVTNSEDLTKHIILSLHTDTERTHTEFNAYVNECHLMHFLTSPWLHALLVNVWMTKKEFTGSLCEINCILIDLLFKKANAKKGYFKSGHSMKCLSNTSFIKENVEIFDALANAAFHFTFSSKKCLAFSEQEIMNYLFEDQVQFCLNAGVLTRRRSLGLAAQDSQFSFIHETVQEFLAAYHIANSKQDLIAYFQAGTKYNVLEMSQTVIYLGGLDCDKGNELLDSLADVEFLNNVDKGLSMYVKKMYDKEDLLAIHKDNYTKINNVKSIQNQKAYDAHCIALSVLFQRMLVSCCIEAKASGQKEICLNCNDFTFSSFLSNSDSKALQSLLMFNKSNVRSLILERNVLQTSEILTVLQHSKRSLKRVITTLTPDINKALHQASIQELHCTGKMDVSLFTCVLPSLSQLTFLIIEDSSFSENIVPPNNIQHIALKNCTCTAVFLRRLLVHLSSLDHNVRCSLLCANVIDCNTHLFKSELLLSDLTNILLQVNQVNNDLYTLLHGSSIGELILSTTVDVSLASKFIISLNKLASLYLHGTYIGRCDLKLPSSLQYISLEEVKCSSEWLFSLLITLSSLVHPVKCGLWNVVLQSYGGARGDDSHIHVPDLRSEILLYDLSKIEILVNNGSLELFEVFRDTSIGILNLTTAECMSYASQILNTLSKLTTLYVWGTYTGQCDLRLPASLQYINLQKVECSSEWLCCLLITLSSLDHHVKCALFYVVLQPCAEARGDYSYAHVPDFRSEILLPDLSNIEILVYNGSMELFEKYCDTSIGILDLRTADCVSYASQILYTLSKLKQLYLRGTYTGRCDLRLPASLQCISMIEVKCSSEWLFSLLITLSSLDHPVKCELWNVVLQ